jgi:hypothetical protein
MSLTSFLHYTATEGLISRHARSLAANKFTKEFNVSDNVTIM